MNDLPFRELIKSIPLPVAVIDLRDKTVTDCTPDFLSTVGVDRPNGQSVDTLFADADGSSIAKALDRIRERQSNEFLSVTTRRNGTVAIDLRPISDSSPMWATMTVRSVSRAAESDSYDAIVRAILDNTTAVIYAKDNRGRYKLINRRFEELFELKMEKVVGATDFDIFDHDQAEAFSRNDRLVMGRQRRD